MSVKAWRTLAGVMVALGIPAAVIARSRDLVSRHLALTILLGVAWVLALGTWAIVRQAAAEPVKRRLVQAGNAVDWAVGRWMSGYRRRYRRWVLDSERYVDVKGLATAGDYTPQLDEVYVDVALARRAPHQVSGDPLSDVPENVTERYSIRKFLDRKEPVVLAVIGPPGCGKSTLLAYVARCSAQAKRRDGRGVPILLALRDHAAAVAAHPEITLPEMLRSTVRALPVTEPTGWWERQLQRGKCVVLLDGLDEVAREQDRQAVATWVEQQIGSYPGNHFVITSRPRGYRNAFIGPANVLAIRPFTNEQVRQFVHGWYLATERRATRADSKDEMRAVRLRADAAAGDLLRRLTVAPALQDLTVNPLLLTMIANVHRYRGALPGSRADLYGEICQVMLSRRIQAKNLPEQMPWAAKEKLLMRLAYEMMRHKVLDLSRSEALDVLRPGLRRMPGAITGQEFLDDVSFNGLVVERENGQYAFAHLTFQEYLAARHIRENALRRKLIGVVDDEWWRETTLLYAATSDTDPIVSACLKSGTIPALSLAFDCASTGHELAPELRQRLGEVYDAAFQTGCDQAHRRLIAAVLASRLGRQTITTSTGTRICTQPVPVTMYWLFLQESKVPPPDGPCSPESDPSRPATGIWGSEAVSFLNWLNTITTDPVQAQFRLPTLDELNEPEVSGGLDLQSAVTSLWTLPQQGATSPQAWIAPERPNPHTVSGTSLRQAVTIDTIDTALLLQLSVAACCTVALSLMHAVEFDRSLARKLALGLAEDLNLALDRADDPDLDLGLAQDLAHDLAGAIDSAHDNDLACDLARDLARGLTRDFSRARDLALALALDIARDLAHDLNLDLNLDLDLDLDEFVQLTWRWLIGKPLEMALRQATNAPSNLAGERFVEALMSGAGVSNSTQIEVPLDGSLSARVRQACAAYEKGKNSEIRWDPRRVAAHLADTADLLFDQRSLQASSTMTGIRVAALALAGDLPNNEIRSTFHTIAAAVTLLQRRAKAEAAIGESIVLARA